MGHQIPFQASFRGTLSFALSLIGVLGKAHFAKGVQYHILLLELKTELVSSTRHGGGVSLAKRVLSGGWGSLNIEKQFHLIAPLIHL